MDFDYINQLNKPEFQPPAIVFKVVWMILYILMFWSLYIYLNTEPDGEKHKGIIIFIIQLTLNYMWSPIFFYYHKIFLALCVSVLLTISVFIMIICFYSASKVAGIMNIPYFLWLCFADYLNYKLWILNAK